MTAIQSHMNAVKAEIIRHAATYPGPGVSSLAPWREKFDTLRSDLERLIFAAAHPVPTSSSQPLGL